jgi:group I intron endonuclease
MKYIYKIECLVNNKIYIGQTNNIKRRFLEHKRLLRNNEHSNHILQTDYNKYTLSNFKFQLIEACNDNLAQMKEDHWIDYFGGIESENVYNYQNNKTNNKEMSLKISKANKGILLGTKNPMYNKHTNNWNHKCYNETKHKISKSKCTHFSKYKTLAQNNLKYSEEFINQLRDLRAKGFTNAELSNKFNIARSIISNLILYGRSSGK